jgi:hypothetical protein
MITQSQVTAPTSFSEIVSTFKAQKFGSWSVEGHFHPSPEETLGYLSPARSSDSSPWLACAYLSETRTTVTVLCVRPYAETTHVFKKTFRKDYRGYGRASNRTYLSLEETAAKVIAYREAQENSGYGSYPFGALDEVDASNACRLHLDKAAVEALMAKRTAQATHKKKVSDLVVNVAEKAQRIRRTCESSFTPEILTEVEALLASLTAIEAKLHA